VATNFLVHEKIWFEKFKKFYEQMNRPVCIPSSWMGWSGGAPSWCPWATASTSYRSSVWWRTRWRPTCWKKRSPSLRSMCRVSTSQLSTRSEA
uniref:Uncharacterized protein n=1 Tax=Propithecus coquereli TaxID=379532 RepID=A0A2K6GCH0_PROCO